MNSIQNQEFYNIARDLAFQLVREATWYQKRCCWTGHELGTIEGQYKIVFRSFGADLYNGSAGIVLFLANFNRYENDPIVKKTTKLEELSKKQNNLSQQKTTKNKKQDSVKNAFTKIQKELRAF